MKIELLYATETGNAEMLCDDFEGELGDGFDCTIQNMGEVDPTSLDRESFYIFVASSYGSGDLPSTAVSFFDRLVEEKPDLSGVQFAVFGLGDMVFDATFNQGSERLMTALLENKASMIGERGIFDTSTGDLPEDVGLPWLQTIIPQLSTMAA